MQVNAIINSNILDSFCVELPKATKLFKGFDSGIQFDYNSKSEIWLASCVEDAQKYGKTIVHLETKKKLKLLNVTSHLFRMHFLDQVNLLTKGKELVNANYADLKENILLPLGLPNTAIQNSIVKKKATSAAPEFCGKSNPDPSRTQQMAEYFGYHRYSGGNLDKLMVAHMREIYGKLVDGYIQPMKVPSCWHNVFDTEVCLFEVINKIGPSSVVSVGKQGGSKKTKSTVPIKNKNRKKQKGGTIPWMYNIDAPTETPNRDFTEEEHRVLYEEMKRLGLEYHISDGSRNLE